MTYLYHSGMTYMFIGWILCAMLFAAPILTAGEAEGKQVKEEFLHSWNSYKTYAWGHDALKPLSKQPHDWYGVSLLMTPVDAFDTMILLGLTKEAEEAKAVIFERLSFDKNIEVQAFEIVIRLLGGLLSAYQLDGDPRFLALAEDLGKRLLPVFNSATGMPYRYVHLQTGAIRDSINNPAEIGTSLIEFGTLSKLTGNPIYYEKSKRALVELFRHRSSIGLVGSWINVETGVWKNTSSHIGGGIDSYYEYLLKGWKLFGDEDCKAMYDTSIAAVQRYIAEEREDGLWYGVADMQTGKKIRSTYGSLEGFFPAVLALAGDMDRAERLQRSGFMMWNLHGIEPEEYDYAEKKITAPAYHLRPEIIESAYYLSSFTRKNAYRDMGMTFYTSLTQYCRAIAGYAHLKSVVTKEKSDAMESFFFAETLKYLYLLLAEEETLFLTDGVFNTEAHPIRKTWN